MPITVLPPPDQSGAIAGWEALARGIQIGQSRRRQRQESYQALITQLSHPDTTEEQQNAILTQDPQQFRAFYGVPIEQVGKDVLKFRTAAQSVQSPSGMDMNRPEFAGTKRVLVEHPGGTARQQQERATLTATQANTEQSRAQMREAEARTELASAGMRLNVAQATTSVKKDMRVPDANAPGGLRVPTFNEVRDYIDGKLELVPNTPENDKREAIAYIYGLDPDDPVGRTMIHALNEDIKKSGLDVDKTAAEIRDINARAALHEQEWGLIQNGIDPRTGKPMTGGADTIEPTKLQALGKGWNEAITKSIAPFGMPSQVITKTPPFANNIQIGPFGAMLPEMMWKKAVVDNPKIAGAIFGNGRADPASVRADLLATVPAGSKLVSIKFPMPTIDQKTGMVTTQSLSVDEAVPRVVQMRRSLTTELPVLFEAMRQASPATLIYMAAGDPLILQAARTYAPDVFKLITDAQTAADVASGKQAAPGAAEAPADPNATPLLDDIRRITEEMNEIKRTLGISAAAPGTQ